jgi:hypothetical protein
MNRVEIVGTKFKVLIDFLPITNQYYVSVISVKHDLLIGTTQYGTHEEAYAFVGNVMDIQ